MHAVHILSGKIQMSPRCLLLGPVVRPPAAVRIGRRERERFGNPLDRSDGWIARHGRERRERERDRSDKYLCTVNRFGKERGTPGCGNVAKVGLEGVGRVGD